MIEDEEVFLSTFTETLKSRFSANLLALGKDALTLIQQERPASVLRTSLVHLLDEFFHAENKSFVDLMLAELELDGATTEPLIMHPPLAELSANCSMGKRKLEDDSTDRKKKYVPQLVPGMLAVCPACGYRSVDFNLCQRCRRALPADCKRVPRRSTVPALPQRSTDVPRRQTMRSRQGLKDK